MIQHIEVVVNPASMIKSKYNSITGEIFFQIGNEIFPEENWSDFIVVVLSWWLNAFRNFYESGNNSFEMNFMDGPLAVECTPKTEDVLKLYFVKKYTDGEDIITSTDCNADNLKKSLLAAAKKVLSEIENRKWETPDIVSLKNVVYSFDNNPPVNSKHRHGDSTSL